MWKPLEHALSLNILIAKVCSKLHNVSIRHWKKHGKNAQEIAQLEVNYSQHQRDAGVFLEWGDNVAQSGGSEEMNDQDINLMYGNSLLNEVTNRTTSKRKADIMKKIFDAGIRYHVSMDNDFTYNNDGMLLND